MYNNNYLKCPICKVSFKRKYIKGHYAICFEKYKKLQEIRNYLLTNKNKNNNNTTTKRNNNHRRNNTNRNNVTTRINNTNTAAKINKETQIIKKETNLYRIYNTTDINEKYTYYYHKYLENKNVALVGPASSIMRTNSGRIIDTFDIIVRLNKSLPVHKKLIKDVGSRTDILYNSFNRSDYPGDNIINEDFFINNGLKFLCTSYPNLSPFNQDIRYYLERSQSKLPFRIVDKDLYYKIKNNINSRPNTGIMAIVDLLNTNLKKLYITGFNFYKTSYYKSYQKGNNQIVPYSNDTIHDQNSQISLLKYIVLTDNRIIIDRVLYKILFSNYINFFRNKKSIDGDNIFKFNDGTSRSNILLNKYKNPVFVGVKNNKVNISGYDLVICISTENINRNTNNVPIISVANSRGITAIINLYNDDVDDGVIEYRCNKKHYKQMVIFLRNIGIYKFSIEMYIYLCVLHYFPSIKVYNVSFKDDEALLYRYIQSYNT
jgi:hypothetical protein